LSLAHPVFQQGNGQKAEVVTINIKSHVMEKQLNNSEYNTSILLQLLVKGKKVKLFLHLTNFP
jgi:ribosomal protein L25 (general stress protein Ctc)